MSHLPRPVILACAALSLLGCSSKNEEEPPAAEAAKADPSSGAEHNYEAPVAPPIEEPAPPGSTSPDERATIPEEPKMAPLGDEQSIRILNTINGGEVEQAKVALSKAKDARVKKFAKQMADQHSKAKDKTITLSKKEMLLPANSSVANDLEDKGSEVLTSLGLVEGADFDKTYMDAQVQQHEAVLELLESRLIPSALNPQLQTELVATKKMVEQHLAKAREIQQQIDR